MSIRLLKSKPKNSAIKQLTQTNKQLMRSYKQPIQKQMNSLFCFHVVFKPYE